MPYSTHHDDLLRWFHEIPEKAPCYAAIVLYSLGGLACLVLTMRSKAWFMLVITVAAWLEVIGFGYRLAAIDNPNMANFVAMQGLLIITPVLLPLVNYIVVGRLILLGDATRLPVRPVWVARCFTSSDVFCLMLQGAGGGLISSTNPGTHKMGVNLLLAGLFLQLFFFTCFTSLALWVQHSEVFGLRRYHLRQVYICLYTTIALLYIRNIFRVIEFLQGYDGYLAAHEVFFYVFDFAMICGSVFVYCIFHFGYNMPTVPDSTASGPAASGGHAGSKDTDASGAYEHVRVKPSSEASATTTRGSSAGGLSAHPAPAGPAVGSVELV